MSSDANENRVPISEKTVLTVQECSALTGIGQNTLDLALNDPNCPFVLRIGRKRMIIRKLFDEYIETIRELPSPASPKRDNQSPFCFSPNLLCDSFAFVPDRCAHSSTRTYSIMSHIVLRNPSGLECDMIDESAGSAFFDAMQIPEDMRIFYNPDELVYKDSNKCVSVSDAIKSDWQIPAYEKNGVSAPMGAYVVNSAPMNTIVVDSSDGALSSKQVIEPLIDIWSRENDPCSLVISDCNNERVSKYADILKARGYNVVVIDCDMKHGSMGYNPLIPAIRAVRSGDFINMAICVETTAHQLFECVDEDVSSGETCAAVMFKIAIYLLIGMAYDEEASLKTKAGVDELLPEQVDDIWSSVTYHEAYKLILQLSQTNYCVDDFDISDCYKNALRGQSMHTNGISLFGTIMCSVLTNAELCRFVENCLNKYNTLFVNDDVILATALQKLSRYDSEVARAIMSCRYAQSFDTNSFVNDDKPVAVFVETSATGMVPFFDWGKNLFALFIRNSVNCMFPCTVDRGLLQKKGVRYVIDNCDDFGQFSDFWSILPISLGVNQAFVIVTHSLSAVKSLLHCETFDTLSENVIFLKSSDNKTVEYISKASEHKDGLSRFVKLSPEDIMFKDINSVITVDWFSHTVFVNEMSTAFPVFDTKADTRYICEHVDAPACEHNIDYSEYLINLLHDLEKGIVSL